MNLIMAVDTDCESGRCQTLMIWCPSERGANFPGINSWAHG